MARTRIDAQITTRNARKQLKPRKKPYCRSLGPTVAIGYQRKQRGGVWQVVESLGKKRYRVEQIGIADDFVEANGATIYDFEQAKSAAVARIALWQVHDRASADGPAPTVRSAAEIYMEMQEARERVLQGKVRLRRDARLRLSRHILSDTIADIELHALKEADLAQWRDRRSADLSVSTVRRIVNDFKAALNAAAVKHRSRLPPDMAIIIKNGLSAGEAASPLARDQAALPDADVRRIIEASRTVDTEEGWDGDLLRMVVVLSATGARFSQIGRMAVGDVQAAQGRLMVPTSRKGRGTKKTTHIGIRVGADVVELLRPAIMGRQRSEPLLERWRHVQAKGTETQSPRWVRGRRGPWNAASELARPWLEIVTRAGLPSDVVPYALRHSSIVRQLRAGLPVRLVAALHDTSTAMIERHYASAIVDMLDDLSAAAVIPLIADETVAKVVPLRSADPRR
ncbi:MULTISPECIES: tyrosine-type recombinase/integrase [unclassified Mesorhizobium]|uniref:tyrosine-type recombinase/integrase n=1 Tax=unclassified Mesorhizobium TaxID=325217 RepID=UPI00112BC273|nr:MULTISPECIES: tyrosine-type recombinase/integrase [unclassified Mesorhizobium]TPI51715.1 integrase [Mesorhizobium sp. B3-1-1]TPJ57070.1 integrase [Mesorhizobium sp. B2-6-7]TPJ85147.1 integrase [Mesorhizobium sp. B2-6-3]TPJ99114.1 integrase [Mesorhizobium sp. B2-5-10]TPK11058.1 integrase [Mesorhizobium sp. B2-5-11]